MRHFVVVSAIVFFFVPHLAADEFKLVKRTGDGITVSRCQGRTPGFFISRYEVHVAADVDVVSDGLWKVFDNAYPPVVKRTFLQRSKNAMLFNDMVKTPVVSDREYTLRVSRTIDADVVRISFYSDPEAGPPPRKGYVRMAMVRGGWEIRPVEGGGASVRYEIYTEPGGLVPALIVKEPLTEDALNYVRRCLKDAVGSN